MDKYSSIDGELGARLKESISKKGEGYLCEICDAHPRFKNFFTDRVEIGIGLCCEEAARIILNEKEAFFLEFKENGEPCGDNSDF